MIKFINEAGQEIEAKDLDKATFSKILNENILGQLLIGALELASGALKEEVKTKEVEEPNLFETPDTEVANIKDEIGPNECTGDPSNCPVCGEEIELYDFSEALDALKEGYIATRKSWVDKQKSRFLYYVPANVYPTKTDVARKTFGEEVAYSGYIALKTDLGYVTPYTITNPDLFAEDWLISKVEE